MLHQKANMWTFLLISTILVVAKCQLHPKLDAIYNDDTNNEADTPEKNKCVDIQADLTNCYGCYPCDDFHVRSRSAEFISNLSLTDSSCTTTQFCCIPQTNFAVREDVKCGEFYPEGNPRSVRNSLRHVLPGEYPWRAWVYSSKTSKPLCAATYIREDAKALITSATCLKNNLSGPLYVRFTKNGDFTEVKEKIIHQDPGVDIAVLSVSSLADKPEWISPCCISDEPPRFGTTCLAISEDDNYVNTAIPKPIVCQGKIAQSGPSVLCAVAPSTDYRPQHGSALFCPNHNGNTIKYVIHGIALDTTEEGFTRYTNVTHFANWINNQMENLQPHPLFNYRQANPSKHGYRGGYGR